MSSSLIERRNATIGSHSPLFYATPIELVSAKGVWVTDVNGKRYLDAYNNVPHVGHCHPKVVAAIADQSARLNIHTRYLNERVVEYSEVLLAQFEDKLERVFFTNTGSEANELALRIAAQHTGSEGVLVSDCSYHGNTRALAELTTGLTVREPLGAHVRAIHIPDLDAVDSRDEEQILADAIAEVDRAIASLVEAGVGVSAILLDTLFSTEGLVRPPATYMREVADRVRAAGGLVIADEVQAGFGRTGAHTWGYQRHGIIPDFVTLGKPMGNGHPLGGVVTTAALLDEFGSHNMYFNTFAGNPVSAAAGLAVLEVMQEEGLQARADELGAHIQTRLSEVTAQYAVLGPVRGAGLFFGFEIFTDETRSKPDPERTKALVEDLRERGVLLSKIGPHDSVLKIRPPLAIERPEVDELIDRMSASLQAILSTHGN